MQAEDGSRRVLPYGRGPTLAAALNKRCNNAAIRAVSRDTVWEWELGSGEIIRTPSWQDRISIALPARETFASWVERIHPEDRDATIERMQRAIEEGRENFSTPIDSWLPAGVSFGLGSRFYRPRNGLEGIASHWP